MSCSLDFLPAVLAGNTHFVSVFCNKQLVLRDSEGHQQHFNVCCERSCKFLAVVQWPLQLERLRNNCSWFFVIVCKSLASAQRSIRLTSCPTHFWSTDRWIQWTNPHPRVQHGSLWSSRPCWPSGKGGGSPGGQPAAANTPLVTTVVSLQRTKGARRQVVTRSLWLDSRCTALLRICEFVPVGLSLSPKSWFKSCLWWATPGPSVTWVWNVRQGCLQVSCWGATSSSGGRKGVLLFEDQFC